MNTTTVIPLSNNPVDITMECRVRWSSTVKTSTVIPLSPKYYPVSHVIVKTVLEEINEKHIPYHPTPKLCRQRVNVYRNPKKLDFHQPEENSEEMAMTNSHSGAVITHNENECSEESSTVITSNTVPLCPISHVNVKKIKKVYERHIPYYPTPRLRRQRVNVFLNPKKLDFDQSEEDSE